MVSLCGKNNDSKLLDDAKKSKPLNVRAFPRDAGNNGCRLAGKAVLQLLVKILYYDWYLSSILIIVLHVQPIILKNLITVKKLLF